MFSPVRCWVFPSRVVGSSPHDVALVAQQTARENLRESKVRGRFSLFAISERPFAPAENFYCSIARLRAAGSLDRSPGKVFVYLLFILGAAYGAPS